MIKKLEIKRALGITDLAYHNCINTHFALWCNKYAEHFALPQRKLVTNDKLHEWYLSQWMQKVELPFYRDNNDYLVAGIMGEANYQDLFLQYADAVEQVYPAPILKRIANAYKRTQQPA